MTGMTRARGVVNGVPGAIQTIDKRDASQTLFGNAEKVIMWHHDFPTVKYIYENIAGAGFSHFEDGVGVVYTTNQVFIANNDYGPKLYWPIYPISTPISLDGKVLTGGVRCRLERSTAEV